MMNPRVVATIESEPATQKLAVLIDADNAQALVIEALLAEVARFGEATVRRIYGDFTSPLSSQWKKVLNKFAISPVQQFAYTTGKNATDSRLIIDAMDLLHKGNVNGFCLVSSDSDFTGLASRIREEGLTVYGFGERKTPEAFRNACVKFVFTENLRPITDTEEGTPTAQQKPTSPTDDQPSSQKPVDPQADRPNKSVPMGLLKEAFEKTSDDTGWAHLAALGSYLTKLQPDFDSRSFGFKKLKDLFMALPQYFECKEKANSNSPAKVILIRMK